LWALLQSVYWDISHVRSGDAPSASSWFWYLINKALAVSRSTFLIGYFVEAKFLYWALMCRTRYLTYSLALISALPLGPSYGVNLAFQVHIWTYVILLWCGSLSCFIMAKIPYTRKLIIERLGTKFLGIHGINWWPHHCTRASCIVGFITTVKYGADAAQLATNANEVAAINELLAESEQDLLNKEEVKVVMQRPFWVSEGLKDFVPEVFRSCAVGKDIGAAAVGGIRDGVRDAVHDRVREGISRLDGSAEAAAGAGPASNSKIVSQDPTS
jgi:hypothetical protein